MALIVRLMDLGDRERFDTGVNFGVGDKGELTVWDASAKALGMFAQGQWVGVMVVEPRKQVPTSSSASQNIHVYVDGKEVRQVAATETSAALNLLADSIGKQAG